MTMTNVGSISHTEALKKVHDEYYKYMQNHLTRAEKDYLEIMNIELKKLEKIIKKQIYEINKSNN